MINALSVTGKLAPFRRLFLGFIFSLGIAVAGCAGKSDMTPIEAQKQAFDILCPSG